MALDRLNYASSGERTDFSGMMSLLSYFSLKLNLYVGKKISIFILLRALKKKLLSSTRVFLFFCPPSYLPTTWKGLEVNIPYFPDLQIEHTVLFCLPFF